MENASKALIIAGSILIAIIIISLGVMVFRNMSGSVQENASLTKEQMVAFNNKILPYIGNNVSGSQVNAQIQYARSVNPKAINDQETGKYITITGKGTVSVNGTTVNYTLVQTGKYYNVSGEYEDGLLKKINIS